MNKDTAERIVKEHNRLYIEHLIEGLTSVYALDCSGLSESEVRDLACQYALSIVHVGCQYDESCITLHVCDANTLSDQNPIGVELTEGFNDNILVYDTMEALERNVEFHKLYDTVDPKTVPSKRDDQVYVIHLNDDKGHPLTIEPRYRMMINGCGSDNIHVALT